MKIDIFPKGLFRFRSYPEQWRRTLRSVDIAFESRRVLPGDSLSGKVIIRTDKSFECNRVVLKACSKERTEYGSGENRRVDEEYLLSRVFRISEGRTIPEGNTAIPFSFRIPGGMPPSYRGYQGDIKHTVEAVVEVDWALDPKAKREYRVLQNRPPYIPSVGDTRGLTKEDNGFHVRLDENVLRLDRGIHVRCEVAEQKERMNRIRVDIVKREDSKCHRHQMKNESNVRRRYLQLGKDDWGRWKELSIGDNWQYHLPFNSRLFRISYFLKVTLEISWELDPSVRFRLKFSDIAPEPVEEQDVLGEIAMDLGFDEW